MGGDSVRASGNEDDDGLLQPPLKRLKLSSPHRHYNNATSNSNDNSVLPEEQQPSPAAPFLCANGRAALSAMVPKTSSGSDVVGDKGLIRRVEFVRIMTQALCALGYERAAAVVEEESGIALQLPIVSAFREEILGGRWDDSVGTLAKVGAVEEPALKAATFYILQQKFLEQLLCKRDTRAALKTLRSEISPLQVHTDRVHELASCVVCPREELLTKVGWQGDGPEARMGVLRRMQELLPPHIMIPERRLEHLVEQALTVQRESCVFHNTLESALCLYSDHKCGRDQIPTETVQVLEAHDNEVWYLQFSRDGRHLASASKDCKAIIWEVVDNDRVKLKHVLTGHLKEVSFVAWSPDDSMILTCGAEGAVKLWDCKTGRCKYTYEKTGGLTSCSWFPDGRTFATGAGDKAIYKWDLKGNELEAWKWHKMPRIHDLVVTADGKSVLCISSDHIVRIMNLENKSERTIEEDVGITSLSVSPDGKSLLLNLISQEIHLRDLTSSNSEPPCKYKGHRQGRYVIRSCFGGNGCCFIVSGSEDSQVYIWHRNSGMLLEALPGHAGTVNCVSWNPRNPHMFASASDDHTIRIWGLKNSRKGSSSNGSNISIIINCNHVNHCSNDENSNKSSSSNSSSSSSSGGNNENNNNQSSSDGNGDESKSDSENKSPSTSNGDAGHHHRHHHLANGSSSAQENLRPF